MFKPPRGILGDERGRGEGGVGGRWAPLRRALRPAAIVILVVVVLYQYNLLDYVSHRDPRSWLLPWTDARSRLPTIRRR